ncbi:MAG: dihydrodipicolinate synthase family protein, partial [Anaerolineae bacterium]
ANVAPRALIHLYQLFLAGEWDEAAALQRRLVPANTAVTAQFGIAGLKAALDMLDFRGGPVRLPLLPLSSSEIQALKAILESADLL